MSRRRARRIADGGRPDATFFRSFDRPVISYDVDSGPIVRAVNPAFEAIEGTASVEPGVRLGEALAAIDVESDVLAQIERAATEHLSVVRTTTGSSGDGRRRSVRVVPAPTDGSDDDRVAGFVVVDDASRDDRIDRLETFARVVSHDLRNPLDVARIRLDAAEETGETTHFEKVRCAHDRIERIVRDVLFLTDPGAGVDATPVDLGATARTAWETVDTGEATLGVEADLVIAADDVHLQRLFENLFRNAVEHSASTVSVTVGGTDDGFYVADDGPGFPADEREHLFEPGVSANDGSGLGLAVVHRIATAHGWTVRPEESDAGGARLSFADVDVVQDSN